MVVKFRKSPISRAEIVDAALKDPDFKRRFEQSIMPFAKLLREMRAKVGLTQEEVAKRSGYARPLISMLECGTLTNTSWTTMTALAEACGFRLVLTAEEVKADESQ